MSQHDTEPPFRSAILIDTIRGDDDLDAKLLREMADEAIDYIRSFDWCAELHESYFGDGVGGIVALFLCRVTIRKIEEPEWIWVVVGDLPSAYMEFDVAPNPRAALLRYIEGVEEWLAATPEERSSDNLIPIEVPHGDDLMDALRGRMETLRSIVLPNMRES